MYNLPGGSAGMISQSSAIMILNDDVYIAGVFGNTSISTACYWKNGTLIELSSNASANDIVVVAKN